MGPETGPGPEFLKQKYDLHNSEEVGAADDRTEQRTDERVAHDAESRIQNYLDRLQNILHPAKLEGHENFDRGERNIEMLKNSLHDHFIVKPEEISESYWETQKRIIRERGQQADLDQADWETLKQQNTEAIIADQTSSLDNWTDYLTSEDAPYPDWLKYWSFRSVLSIGGFDKERHVFSKRSVGTTKPYPDINREALSYVLDAMEKKYQGKDIKNLEGEEKEQFQKLLSGENFAKLYAWAIEKVTPASVEQITITEGKWVKYEKGSDHMPLVESLQGHGTGWCTAGESTARTQLDGGDFYVYYSVNQDGNPTIPRAAIRMQGDQIGEVRGIAAEQNLDPYIGDVVQQKLEEFPDGKAYEKKVADMKLLTEIENKTKTGTPLSKVELVFLYEIDSPIQGFGFERDPRIEELRSQRDPKVDAPIVLDCQPEEIARSQNEINDGTKAYIGPFFPGIFQRLSNIEHLYTSFPEGKIRKSNLEIGGQTSEQLENAMREKNIDISSNAKYMLRSPDFTTLPNAEQIKLIRLSVRDLDLPYNATTDLVYAKAEEYGLELCPAEAGPHQRLQDAEQSVREHYRIAIKQITSRDGHPLVFHLYRNARGLGLHDYWAGPDNKWDRGNEFVFRLRNVSQES